MTWRPFRLMPADRFVDLGGGTGIYLVDILELVALETPVLVRCQMI
ncbi:MAG TPA: hypothetical protein VLS27_01915 [Gammaproteobacteria bacterium]|nr:hypothetical protein [Gammaproteobacteria bacterium]